MGSLRRVNMLPKSAKLATLIEIGVIYLSLQGALPAALAVFPQVILLFLEISVSFFWILISLILI